MARVVSDQKHCFDTNELFRRLSRETEIKYIGYMDRTAEERQAQFTNGCRVGKTDIAFINSGTNFPLRFFPWGTEAGQGISPTKEYVDFERERGKVYIKAPFILNGVCVHLKGWISLTRLDGMAYIEFDEEQADAETSISRINNNYQQPLNKMLIKTEPNRKHSVSDNHGAEMDKRARLQ